MKMTVSTRNRFEKLGLAGKLLHGSCNKSICKTHPNKYDQKWILTFSLAEKVPNYVPNDHSMIVLQKAAKSD